MSNLATSTNQVIQAAAGQRFSDMDPLLAKTSALALVQKLMRLVGAKPDSTQPEIIDEVSDFVAEHLGRNWTPEEIILAHRKAAAGELPGVDRLYSKVDATSIGQVMAAYATVKQDEQRRHQNAKLNEPSSYIGAGEIATRNREAFEVAYERAEEEFQRTGALTEQAFYFYITDYMIEEGMLDVTGREMESAMNLAEERLKSGDRSTLKGHKEFKRVMAEIGKGNSGMQTSLAKTILLEKHLARKSMGL